MLLRLRLLCTHLLCIHHPICIYLCISLFFLSTTSTPHMVARQIFATYTTRWNSMSATISQPWKNSTDTLENNLRAKKAYTALLTVIAKQPVHEEYMNFSTELKSLAETKYNFTFPNETVSTFVTAFYDAVLLYAYALNDSISNDPTELCRPMNGTKLTHLMWNRSFTGITGNVTIDKNGDRISDYSLLDMDPETGFFRIVANYYNRSGLKYVEGQSIHWAGDRKEPPFDKPICGFDNSLCPGNVTPYAALVGRNRITESYGTIFNSSFCFVRTLALPGYAILSFVLGIAIVIMAIISFFGYRHYKLEAEIHSMAWKVNWADVLPCNPTNKTRGSIYSLAKRGSQLVRISWSLQLTWCDAHFSWTISVLQTVYSEEMGSLAGDKQLFIPLGFYKGCKVAIKRINQKNIHLNRALMLELKKVRELLERESPRKRFEFTISPFCRWKTSTMSIWWSSTGQVLTHRIVAYWLNTVRKDRFRIFWKMNKSNWTGCLKYRWCTISFA